MRVVIPALRHVVLLTLAGVAYPVAPGAGAFPFATEVAPSPVALAMQSALVELSVACRDQGPGRAAELAVARGFSISEGCIRVVIERDPCGEWGDLSLRAPGGAITGRYGRLVEVAIPIAALEGLSRMPGVRWVRLPFRPLPCVVSEGVALTGAEAWHGRGITGEGVEVAIIDVGFQGLAAAIASGELPADVTTMDFTGYGMESLSKHGTVVAEIVHDMAPGAHLTLLNTYSEVQLGQAKDYCVQHGIRVVNHSVGYENTGGHDGTGIVCEVADDAAAQGILWCNAAGNHARKHYRGPFTDADGDSLHEFGSGSSGEFNSLGNLNAGSPIWVYMSWYDWPTTSEDYDLELWGNDGTWRLVRASATRQTGTQPPTEEIIGYSVPFAGQYGVAARSYRTTASHGITFLSAYQELGCQTPAGSILQPADAAGSFAVAAIDEDLWTTGPQDGYSSQGPTYDGRPKPDISGPSGVSTWTGGSGAAVDSVYGWGRLDLPLELGGDPAVAGAVALMSVSPNPFNGQIHLTFELRAPATAEFGIYDAAGQRVGSVSAGFLQAGRHAVSWGGTDEHGAPLGPGTYFVTHGGVTSRIVLVR
ncbi:MAG: S8 family serine peptidase [Candidatus Eisenbacteria bacterium]|nr:S8 family serine peptidase [Candidatus Eisenbacteria bacterium]